MRPGPRPVRPVLRRGGWQFRHGAYDHLDVDAGGLTGGNGPDGFAPRRRSALEAEEVSPAEFVVVRGRSAGLTRCGRQQDARPWRPSIPLAGTSSRSSVAAAPPAARAELQRDSRVSRRPLQIDNPVLTRLEGVERGHVRVSDSNGMASRQGSAWPRRATVLISGPGEQAALVGSPLRCP